MYIPNANREEDDATLLAFMQAHRFATLVSQLDGELIATHVPVVTQARADGVHISGHVAKSNPHWHAFGEAMLIIFSGPHAYVSATLYETRASVPTWNYVAVHAYGVPEALHFATDAARTTTLMQDLIDQSEASYQAQWQEQSDAFKTALMGGIVFFEMVVTRLEGKYKLSQNRSYNEQQTVAQTLLASADPSAVATGQLMLDRLEPDDL